MKQVIVAGLAAVWFIWLGVLVSAAWQASKAADELHRLAVRRYQHSLTAACRDDPAFHLCLDLRK